MRTINRRKRNLDFLFSVVGFATEITKLAFVAGDFLLFEMASSTLISDSEAWKSLKVLGLVGVKLNLSFFCGIIILKVILAAGSC